MTSGTSDLSNSTAQPLYIINRLALKAFKSIRRESLIFTILNDTIHLIRYDRGLLWNLEGKKPTLIGISGETELNQDAAAIQGWNQLLSNIDDLSRVQIIEPSYSDSFKQELDEVAISHQKSTVLWFPIFSPDNELVLGLWLELWVSKEKVAPPHAMMNLMLDLLLPAYGAAWKRQKKKLHRNKWGLSKVHYLAAGITVFCLTLLIPVPSRVVAPCEIVPQDPYMITAPIEGVIEKVFVNPGQKVAKETLLFSYDKDAPLQQYEVAKREVMVLEAEVKRAAALGLDEEKYRSELPIAAMKLEKEKADLNLAKYYVDNLNVRSPIEGVVSMHDPDDWSGKPVSIGERILTVSNPNKTKVKIWIPENDNASLKPDSDVRIILNVDPSKKYEARLKYVSNQTMITEKHVPSYVAEAVWSKPPKNSRLGLKGTAVLYGEKISLFYYVFRKPISFVRNLLGI